MPQRKTKKGKGPSKASGKSKTVVSRRVRKPTAAVIVNVANKKPAPQKHVKQIMKGKNKSPGALLATAMSLPSNCSNLRLVTRPGEVACSACASLHGEVSISTGKVKGTYEDTFPGGTYWIAMFRDPLRNYVHFAANDANKTYVYSVVFYDPLHPTPITGGEFYTLKGIENQIQPLHLITTSDFQPHGPILYPGADKDGYYYVWLDTDAVFAVAVNATAAGDSISVYKWVGNDRLPYASVLVSTLTYSFTCSAPGYYAFSLNLGLSSTTTHITAATITGTGDAMGHLCSPSFGTLMDSCKKYRVTASAVQLTDTAALLNRGGRIHGAWCDGTTPWWDRTDVEQLSQNGTVEGLDYQTFNAETGFYAFLKPKDDVDFAFRDNIAFDKYGKVSDCYWPMDDPSAYVVARIDINASGTDLTTVAPGMDFIVRQFTAVEWQTSAQVYERHLAETTYLDFVNAMSVLRLMPCLYENPTHFERLRNAVKGAYNMVRVHGGGIGSLMSVMFPASSGFAAGLSAVSRVLPNWD